jgi:(2S)-methylsuccinyl-CoA dehydrogenase
LLLFEKQPGNDFAPPHLTGSPIPTIGYHGMKSFGLSFDDAFVPAGNLIGAVEGRGFYQLMATYESARIQTAARGVGVAQAAYECAVKYARERTQFGQPIGDFQVIRHKLAHMAVEVEAGRQLAYFAASQKDTGKRCDYEAGLAKVFAAEMAERVTREAMQIHGGYGYSMEFNAQRFWRDARVLSIFEGTSEIQLEVIGRRIMEKQG